jgi:hypothetical protein
MAIDRDAVAWVNYVQSGLGDSAGAIYRVNTTDASCTAIPPVRMPAGWFRLGMGFSTAAPTTPPRGPLRRLHGGPLGGREPRPRALDPARARDRPHRAVHRRAARAERRAHGHRRRAPLRLLHHHPGAGRRDRQGHRRHRALLAPHQASRPRRRGPSRSGAETSTSTPRVGALLGGTATSRATAPRTGVDTSYMRNIGFRIVGAGVSTCAPILPPG